MMTSAFIMSRSEYVLGRPRERLAGSGGQGSRSTRTIRLTSRLGCRSISVPPQCGCVVTEILRGQPCCGDAWHGCFIYDHVSISCQFHLENYTDLCRPPFPQGCHSHVCTVVCGVPLEHAPCRRAHARTRGARGSR